jgi:hypothetical protein
MLQHDLARTLPQDDLVAPEAVESDAIDRDGREPTGEWRTQHEPAGRHGEIAA